MTRRTFQKLNRTFPATNIKFPSPRTFTASPGIGRVISRRAGFLRALVLAGIGATATQAVVSGQGLTGQIAGRIQDPSDRPAAGVSITLTSADTGRRHVATTNNSGDFLFPDVSPGTFDIRIESPGFKTFEQKGLALSSGQLLALSLITLQLGQVTETVSVTADAASLDTQSSDRSGLIDSHQLQQLSLKGRDYLGLLRLLPGVLDIASATREAPGNLREPHGVSIRTHADRIHLGESASGRGYAASICEQAPSRRRVAPDC